MFAHDFDFIIQRLSAKPTEFEDLLQGFMVTGVPTSAHS